MKPRKKDEMIGQVFGRWTVIGFSHRNNYDNLFYWCRCSCSEHAIRPVNKYALKSGLSKSCGCYRNEMLSASSILYHLRQGHQRGTFFTLPIIKWDVEEIVMRYRQAYSDNEETMKKEAAKELVLVFSSLFEEYLSALKQTGSLSNHKPYLYTFFRKVLSEEEWDRFLGKTNYTFEQRWELLRSAYKDQEDVVTDLTETLLDLALRYDGRGAFKRYVIRALPYHFADIVFARYRKGILPQKKLSEFVGKMKKEEVFSITEEMLKDSPVFSFLNERDRKILVLYYAKNYHDKAISEAMGLHINTVNQARNRAVKQLRWKLGLYNEDRPVRQRRSGKKMIA